MKLGLALPPYDISVPDRQPATFDRVARYAELAEALGYAQLWVSDHFWLDMTRYGGSPARAGTPECWTMLSGLAVRTSRVRLGTLVMAVGFRPPALLAKMAATLDQLSRGRLDLGLGAGWNEAEFTENGLPFPRPGERLGMLEEGLGVLRALLTDAGTPGSFSGRWYQVEQAPVIPGPVQRPRPPLWVGGKGDRLLGVVARAADGWNVVWSMTPDDYTERLGALEAACKRAGRSPGEVRRSLGLSTLIGRDADDLVERWRRLQAWTPGGAWTGSSCATGPPPGWSALPRRCWPSSGAGRSWGSSRWSAPSPACRSRCSRTSSWSWPRSWSCPAFSEAPDRGSGA